MPWSDKQGAKKEESDLTPAKALLRRGIEPVAIALQEWLDTSVGAGRKHIAKVWLKEIRPEAAAYIALRTCINAAARTQSLQNTARSIGGHVQHHLNMVTFKQEARGLDVIIERQLKKSTSDRHRVNVQRSAMRSAKLETVDLSSQEQINIGLKLIELCIEHTGLIERTKKINTKKQAMYGIGITLITREWLERQHARCELLNPVYLPMIVPPVAWTSPTSGGYLTNLTTNTTMVKSRNRKYQDDLASVDMPEVYRALNAVQSTAWRINKKVLDVMKTVWDGGGRMGGLPNRDDIELPTRPDDIDTNEDVLKVWKRKAAMVHEDNGRLSSKRLTISNKLWLAERFADEVELYFVHTLDFRGRIYPQVSFVNPQADDTGKSLLQFANGKPLGDNGAYWLAVHIANLFGHDKIPFDERMRWTLDNEDALLDSAQDPLDGQRFWTTADKPYCALAACFEWLGYLEQGSAYVSRIGVALDGSSSGLQHFSAALRDREAGALVNLTPSELPQDIYRKVADIVQAKADASNEPEAEAWKNGKVSRGIAKRPVMTFSYSATQRGMTDQVRSEIMKMNLKLRDEGQPPFISDDDLNAAARWAGNTFYQSIGEVVVKAQEAMDWLKGAAKLCAAHELPVHWYTPLKFPVWHEYMAEIGSRCEVTFGGKRLQVMVYTKGSKLSKKKQVSGIAPNWVHSMDAAHLMATVLACTDKGLNSIAVIHDSFGTHACDTNVLASCLRETFIKQYAGNVLEDFRNTILNILPTDFHDQLPPVPKQGDLDLAAIRDSSFIFA